MKRVVLSVCAAVAAAVSQMAHAEDDWTGELDAVLVATRSAALAAGPEIIPLSSAAYISSGLEVQYDGIDNAGVGQHADKVSSWKDLVGNNDMTFVGGTLKTEADYLNLSADTTGTGECPALATAGAITAEVRAKTTGGNNTTVGAYFSNFMAYLGQAGNNAGFEIRYPMSDSVVQVQQQNGISAEKTTFNTFTLSTEIGARSLYLNGAQWTYNMNNTSTIADGARSSTFYCGLVGTQASKRDAQIQSLRVYSRQLDAREIKMNALVDALRFGKKGAEILPDGVRVSPTDGEYSKLQVRITIDTQGVPVSVNGAAATSEICEQWVDVNAQVTLEANPASGNCVGWANALSSSVFSQDGRTMTFNAAWPLQLKVVGFTPTHVWTGAAGTDFADPRNWADAAGNAAGSAPGSDSSVIIPAGTANQPIASEAIDVAELHIGRLAGGTGSATFTSSTNGTHHVAGRFVVYSGGVLTHTALPNTANAAKDECYKLNFEAETVTICTGGKVDVSARGYAGGKGPGISRGQDDGMVASHGGAFAVGMSYGSLHSPTNCGSGSSYGGSSLGGGAVQFFASGTITVEEDASILAEGGDPLAKSSGAGGSIWLKCSTLVGGGELSVAAQEFTTYGMGGCGGRIAVWQSEGTDFTTAWTGTMSAHSGNGTGAKRNRGGPGTIYLQAAGQTVTNATVVIDNENICSSITDFYAEEKAVVYIANGFVELCARTGSDKIGNLIVRRKAHAMVPSGETVQIFGNVDTTGGYTYFVGSTVQMCGTEPSTFAGSQAYANFVCTEPGKTLFFGTTADDLFAIAEGGSLTLTGEEGATVNLFPAGDDPTKVWKMDFRANSSADVNYASVSNSDASASAQAVTAFYSNDLGGNEKWAFSEPIVVGETITWTGAKNADWFESANWDLERPVADTDVVVVPAEKDGESIANMPSITSGDVLLNVLSVASGASLTLNGATSLTVTNALAVAGALTVASKLTITCTKNVSFAGGSFTAGDSIFLLTGDDDQSVNLNNQRFKNLTIRKESGSVTFSEEWEADVFDCASANALALTFAAGKTYRAEECVFRGRRADGGCALTLRSSTPESAWNLALGSAQYIAGVDVQDSTATLAAAVVDSSSHDSGRNNYWTFSDTSVTNAFWTGGTGSFDTPGNWDTGAIPDGNTRVFVWAGPGETKTVTASAAVTVRDLVLIGVDTGKAGLAASKSLTVLEDVDVRANGTLTVADPEGNVVNGDVVVRANGTITQSADTAKDYKLKLSVDGNLTVEKDGKVHAAGKGYAAMTGPGAAGTGNRGAGGHAGLAYISLGCYGSVLNPVTYGSGGCESAGGGVVQLNVAGTATVEGEISANGDKGNLYASAGGGSVWLVCRSLAGGGLIAANSEPCNCNDGGGGGRVAIEVLQTDTFTGSVEAGGSYPSSSNRSAYDDHGGAGTVYRVGPNQPTGGEIIIDNAQIARDASSVVMSRIAKTQLPMADDGNPMKAYKDKTLTIGRKARVTLTQSMRVGDLNFTASGSILELGTNTLTVSSQEHKKGRGWASGISITSNEVGGVCGKIVWKPQGMAIIVR